MERIGIAASRMAQGNIAKYNVFVILISTLFSILIFLVCGFTVLASLLLISIVAKLFMPVDFGGAWGNVTKMSLVAIGILVGILNILAIIKNIKIGKPQA